MALSVGRIVGLIELRDEFTRKLEAAANAIDRTQPKVTGLTESVDKLAMFSVKSGSVLTAGITVPLMGVATASVMAATKMNEGMANIATLIPGNVARINELKTAVQNMAIATGKSTSDLTGGLYEVISAFGDTSDTASILEINAKAAAAGLATTTEAISLTSAVTKAYGDTSGEAVQKAADLALMTVRLGQTNFPELAASIGRVAPITSQLKISQEELSAVFATLTGVTGGAAEVSTQFRGALVGLQKPSKEMQAALKGMGYETGEAAIQSLGFKGTLDALLTSQNGNQNALVKLFRSTESWAAVAALAGSQSEVFEGKLSELENAAGATDVAFNEQTNGINKAGFAWSQLTSKLDVAAQRIGDRLLPLLMRLWEHAIGPGVDWLLKLVDKFDALDGRVQTGIIVVAGLAAAVGPLLVAFGGITLAVTTVLPLLTALSLPVVAITGLLVALAVAVWKVVDAWHAATAAFREGRLMEHLTAKEDNNFARRWLGLSKAVDKTTASVEKNTSATKTQGEAAAVAATGTDAAGDAAGRTAVKTDTMAKAAEAAAKALVSLRGTLTGSDLIDKMAQLDRAVAGLTDKQRNDPFTLARIGTELDNLTRAGVKLTPTLQGLNVAYKETLALQALTDEAAAKQQAWNESLAKLIETLTGVDIADRLRLLADATALLTDEQKTNPNTIKKLTAEIDALWQAGARLTPELMALAFQFGVVGVKVDNAAIDIGKLGVQVTKPDIPKALTTWRDKLGEVSKHFEQLANIAGGNLGKLAQWMGIVVKSMDMATKAGKQMAAAINGKDGVDWGGLALGALQAAAALDAATSSGSKLKNIMGGIAAGASAGAAFGLWGTAIGSIAGGLIGLFRSTGKEAEKAAKIAEEAAARGAASAAALQKYGIETTATMRVSAITLVDAFDAITRSGVTGGRAVAAMSKELSDFVVTAVRAGTGVPPALRPLLETLIRSGQLSEAAAKALMGIEQQGVPSLDEISQAAERFGFRLDEVGGKVPQLRITAQAEQMARDFDILVNGAGMSMDHLMEKTRDQVQKLVLDALTAGLVLPESLRPWLQRFVDVGLLVDGTGSKLTDLSGLQFQVPLSQKIDELIDKLHELIDSFKGVGDQAVKQFSRARGEAESLGRAVPRNLLGGDFEVPTPTTPGSRSHAEPSASSVAGAQQHIVVNVDGRVIAEAAFRHFPDVAEINGIG